MNLTKGTLVITPEGVGRVAYVRMGGPIFAYIEAVSVVLDKKRGQPSYEGTIFAARYVLRAATWLASLK